jgi:hypothetical protein
MILTEVAFWDTVLTSSERANLQTRGKGMPKITKPENLKLYLPMNDGTIGTDANGDTVGDNSNTGNNGTASGGWWESDPLPKTIITGAN